MKLYKLLHYIALILGFQVSIFFLFFLIADSITDLGEGKFNVIPILLMMILAVGGFVWSVTKPAKGGLVMIAGGLVMVVFLLIMGGIGEWQMALIFGLPFILPGLVFIFTANKVPVFRLTIPKPGR